MLRILRRYTGGAIAAREIRCEKRSVVVYVLGSVSHTSIPAEGFAAIDCDRYEKHVVVFGQTKEHAQARIDEIYPHARFIVHSVYTASNLFLRRLWEAWKYRKLISRIAPDIVHVHHTWSGAVGALVGSRSREALVVTIHSAYTRYTFAQRIAYSTMCWAATVIVCNSDSTRRSLPSWLGRGKCRVIYNGVDLRAIDAAHALSPSSSGRVHVGTIARLVREKDLATLLKALARIDAMGEHEVRATIVGGGAEEQRLRAIAADLGVDLLVRFVGEVSRKEAYRELAQFDVFVVCSRWEGFCNAAVEAAAMGKAIVASDIPVLKEVLGAENAVFFRVGDDLELAHCLADLSVDKEGRARIAERAQAYARTRYALDRLALAHEALYDALAR